MRRADDRSPTALRALVYGLLGWCVEIAFTGVADAIDARDPRLVGTTYLWMLPIYAAGGIGLERVAAALRDVAPRVLRAFAYVAVIYSVELASGLAIRRVVGRCPWDYGGRGVNVAGLVRLDYFPYWLVVALAFETVARLVDRVALAVASPRRISV